MPKKEEKPEEPKVQVVTAEQLINLNLEHIIMRLNAIDKKIDELKELAE